MSDGTPEITSICQPLPASTDATPPNFASDPAAARLSSAQLKVVDSRIAFLSKAVALLGDSNPEWDRERHEILNDLDEDFVGTTLEGINLVTLGSVELRKILLEKRLSSAQAELLELSLSKPLQNLPAEEERLTQVLATTTDRTEAEGIKKYIEAVHRLEDARRSKDNIEIVARVRDAADALKSNLELVKIRPTAAEKTDWLYKSSAFMGSIAIVFAAHGPQSLAALVGSAGSSIAVGGRELINLSEDRDRLDALDRNASDRNQLRMQLSARLNDLHDEHDRLTWSVQHAGTGEDVQ